MKVLIFLLLKLTLIYSTPTTTNAPFSSKLFNEIVKTKSNENVIISPVSIRSCLSLAYMGAEGVTATELHNILQLKGNSKDEVGQEFGSFQQKLETGGTVLKNANRIYLADRYNIDPKYNELTTKYFNAQAEKVNFNAPETVATVNNWVDTQTNHKIKEIIAPGSLDGSVSAILVNAIYFKATWKYKFDEAKTMKKNFKLNSKGVIPVDMMQQTSQLNYGEFPELNAVGIEIPYSNSSMHMLVLLPNRDDGLADLEQKLKDVDLTNMNLSPSKINLQFPKFKIEFGVSLNGILSNLGIKSMFSNGDFSKLTTDKIPLQISEVSHKAFIEVDEQGTEAAAATSILRSRKFPSPRALVFDFIVDHPFFFAIKDDKNVFFAGHITYF